MKFSNVAKKFGVGAALAMAAGSAAAQGVVIDTTEILSAISAGQAAGLAICVAFGVAVWVLRGGKLMRRA